MKNSKRPFGIIATLAYSVFSAIILLPSGFLLLLAGLISEDSSLIFTIYGIFAIALGVFLLAAAFGLWSFQEWGRQVTIWTSIVAIPLGVIAIFPIFPGQEITVANTIIQLVGIGVMGVIIFYLTRATVRKLFIDES